LLLTDFNKFFISNKQVKEMWYGGNQLWTAAPAAEGVVGTGAFDGKTWADIQTLVKAGRGAELFSGEDDTITIQINGGSGVAIGTKPLITECTLRVFGFDKFNTTNTMTLYVDIRNNLGKYETKMYEDSVKANWGSSSNLIRPFINGAFYNGLPEELRNVMTPISYTYRKYGSNSSSSATDNVVISSAYHGVRPPTGYTTWTMDAAGGSTTALSYKWTTYDASYTTSTNMGGTNSAVFIPIIMIG
jgi:hypothetical protein